MSLKIEKKCKKCNKAFMVYPSNKDKKFCSKKCYHSYPRKRGKESKKFCQIKVSCNVCSKTFYKHPSAIKRTNNNLCSKECQIEFLIKKRKEGVKQLYITKKCKICGEKVKRTKAEFKNRPAKNYYCSSECYHEKLKQGRGGFTKFTKKCKNCNKDFWITSRNKRTVKYCSEKCRKEGFPKKEEHNNFKKELDRSYRARHRLYYENTVWRNSVFKRDDYTCQVCNKKGFKIQAHHIENYSSNKEKRFDINNGVTLCIDCHKKFHKTYGVANNNKEQLEEFIKEYDIIK